VGGLESLLISVQAYLLYANYTIVRKILELDTGTSKTFLKDEKIQGSKTYLQVLIFHGLNCELHSQSLLCFQKMH
jgi:hypothetical protein